MAFSDTLKQLRQKHNLTQIELAKRLGVTQRTISYYETGKGIPGDPKLLQKMAQLFGVTLDELLLNDTFDSKYHQLIRKLQQDTLAGNIGWSILDETLITESAPILQEHGVIENESYAKEFEYGAFIVARTVTGFALFILYDDEYSFIADDKQISQIAALYDVIRESQNSFYGFIDKYLNTDLSK